MNKPLRMSLYILAALFLTNCSSAQTAPPGTPRNVVFLLGDGMGFAQVKAYRMYADDPATDIIEPLLIDGLLTGAVSTDSIRMDCEKADGPCTRDPYGITDSASSATAYATGRDTLIGRLSMSPSGQIMTTILEAASAHGKSTGLVATSQITHASPAAFGAHVESRGQYTDIANQYFDNQTDGKPIIDVMLGGGLADMQREDRDLVSEFRSAGYEVALNSTEMQAMKGDRLLGLFAPSGMPRAWDRGETAPALADMTRVALDALNRNQQGFFLMIEGSQIDWAAHGESVAGVVSEMEDFIAAVRVALDFARNNGDTLVVIAADHETGGMSLGREGIYSWNPRPLRAMKATPIAMTEHYLAGEEDLAEIVAANVAFELSAEEIEALNATPREEQAVYDAIAAVFNERTHTGWSSGGHTGVDVPLYAYGPGSERFRGVMQNEAVGRTMWDVFLPE